MPKTPLQMLLRGQNLVGYRNYADDVVEAFVEHAAECGIDVFRVFDALNDERNFETSFKAIKEGRQAHPGHDQLLAHRAPDSAGRSSTSSTTSTRPALEGMGADSICIKDMAGMLSPDDAYDLVGALKQELSIPVQLHTHYTSGMASMTYCKAIEAGVDIIDTCLAPFALGRRTPRVEPIVAALEGTPRDTGLDLEKLFEARRASRDDRTEVPAVPRHTEDVDHRHGRARRTRSRAGCSPTW